MEYSVERICGDRKRAGIQYFLVKWVGYPESENTWEPEGNLDCQVLVDQYLAEKKSKRKKQKQSETDNTADSQQIITQLQYRDVGHPNPSIHRLIRAPSDSDTDSWESDNEIEDVVGVKLVDGEIMFDVKKHGSKIRQVMKSELQRYHTKIYLSFLEELLSKS